MSILVEATPLATGRNASKMLAPIKEKLLGLEPLTNFRLAGQRPIEHEALWGSVPPGVQW